MPPYGLSLRNRVKLIQDRKKEQEEKLATNPSELARLNSDGRETCAKCRKKLVEVQGFASTYKYCPSCEA